MTLARARAHSNAFFPAAHHRIACPPRNGCVTRRSEIDERHEGIHSCSARWERNVNGEFRRASAAAARGACCKAPRRRLGNKSSLREPERHARDHALSHLTLYKRPLAHSISLARACMRARARFCTAPRRKRVRPVIRVRKNARSAVGGSADRRARCTETGPSAASPPRLSALFRVFLLYSYTPFSFSNRIPWLAQNFMNCYNTSSARKVAYHANQLREKPHAV